MTALELKEFRKSLKINQSDFAVWLGCSLASVKFWETNRRVIPDSVVRMVKIYRELLEWKQKYTDKVQRYNDDLMSSKIKIKEIVSNFAESVNQCVYDLKEKTREV